MTWILHWKCEILVGNIRFFGSSGGSPRLHLKTTDREVLVAEQ